MQSIYKQYVTNLNQANSKLKHIFKYISSWKKNMKIESKTNFFLLLTHLKVTGQ
jgi:hypothetical protein